MGKKVSKLSLQKQSGSDNTYFASWQFTEPLIYAADPSAIAKGKYVGFLEPNSSNNKFVNGTAVSKADAAESWMVSEIKGTNVLLGRNKAKTKTLNSWVSMSLLYDMMSGSGLSLIPVKNTKGYTVHWYYSTGDGVLFDGGSSEVTIRNAIYSPPDNAISVTCAVTPNSTTYTEEVKTSNGTSTSTTKVTKHYWYGEKVSKTLLLDTITPPDKPSEPTVTIKQYKLTASLQNIEDSKYDKVQFYLLRDKTAHRILEANVVAAQASIETTVVAGASYDVKCRGVNVISSKKEIPGEWGPWAYDNVTAPGKITKIKSVKANTETSVYISWGPVKNATSYEIQYTDHKEYFDTTESVGSVKVESVVSHAYITGLSKNARYWFRIRAINDIAGSSEWTKGSYSVVLGTTPAAPTVWSNKTVCAIGDILKLYWVQNSEDGSDQTHAQLAVIIIPEEDKENPNSMILPLDEYIVKDEDGNSVYTIDTGKYNRDATIRWSIRTAGITGVYGEWSASNVVKVYKKPSLSVEINQNEETITKFPVEITCTSSPDTQKMVGVSISIAAQNSYSTVDEFGKYKIVKEGEVIFSKYYSERTGTADSQESFTGNSMTTMLYPQDVAFENNQRYTITSVVSLNSGLTAKAISSIFVDFAEADQYTDMSTVEINPDTISALIMPRCVDENDVMPSDVVFSVYRKEFDGTFTLIADDIPNQSITVHDLHPSLDTARYRIVTTNTTTGAISYSDISKEVYEKAIVVQWNDQWSAYNSSSGDGNPTEEPVVSSSILKLPYDIDISDGYSPDVELVEYTGRSHPVSYYGSQIGQTATWNADILRDDTETLYQLRRLARWMGDVYVREPSGSGYWANITVSFSQTHCELTIPVSLSVTRVEGGA